MTADDLPAAFDTLPAAWRAALPGWTRELQDDLVRRVRAVSADREIGPPDPFRALRFATPGQVKVVVLGQDPYPKPGHADGLAFSAGQGRPHSLRRVFEVLEADNIGFTRPPVWKLDAWARQGVLLLNPTLSVEIGMTGSHMDCGWQVLTSQIIQVLCALQHPPVFLLWGKPANAFFDLSCSQVSGAQVLRTRHPSHDMKRQFMAEGSHFVATRHLIDWTLTDEAGPRMVI